MILQIIGVGTVGKTLGEMLEKLGHKVFYKDKNSGAMTKNADFYYICTHEKHILEAMRENLDYLLGQIVVIKSTLNPGLYDEIYKTYGKSTHLLVNPEFLRERDALWMTLNPKYIVVGKCPCGCDSAEKLARLYEVLGASCFIVDAHTAIMVKLASNTYLSTSISFWNEIWMVCQKAEIPSFKVGKITSYENKRIPKHGAILHGHAFQGKCLPKDLNQLITYGQSLGLKMNLLKAVRKVNEIMKRREKKNS